jgi:hypothetical protein
LFITKGLGMIKIPDSRFLWTYRGLSMTCSGKNFSRIQLQERRSNSLLGNGSDICLHYLTCEELDSAVQDLNFNGKGKRRSGFITILNFFKLPSTSFGAN